MGIVLLIELILVLGVDRVNVQAVVGFLCCFVLFAPKPSLQSQAQAKMAFWNW
jgi:hypothetical protein